ncbi:TPA: phage antirepressor N-terminal domain-containing protein [Mannheimia haemolytica]|uniref:P22_AR N-terminal domain n=2 Tax=Mannheimia haemolytica TaxID=75985 RepID=A0A378NCG9_MANHA|nr:phage antirepressor N-terminal domain-containing protein [Mannheimia haemolytica]AGQ37903.1 ATPase [Mannheimia haemolytica D171]AJE08324.1 ATPase [Mannheimia haemolytica USDA-ARS-USMARC-184]EEY09229.1 Putative phage anti-repressor protein [Mannheimia haemolytica serotype A2 str. OVINE]EEY13229.1 putative phage anti-repressor protein [Mannheimia haemolytica serotype A2 str. BOVINE]KYL07011.1 ATPase [Mannheimia haemolytica]
MKALKAKFFGSDILVINQNDKPYVPMKQVAENIGLVWHAQFERLQRNEVLSQGIRVIRIPSNGGEQEAVCLPLHYLNGWLFGVNPSRVNPEIKEKLIRYQTECYEVLWDYWTTGIAKWEDIRQQRENLEENESESKKRGSEAGRALQKRKVEKHTYEIGIERLDRMEQLLLEF